MLSSKRSGLRCARSRALFAHRREVRTEVFQQRLAIRRAATFVAERIDIELRRLDPVALHELPRQRDHFQVRLRTGESEAFDAKLMRLPITSLLRPLVAKDRSDVIEPQRTRRKEMVFERRPDDRRGPLGTQRERASAAIGKRIHLFFDDVGLFADAAHEELGRLEERRANLPVAVARRKRMDARFERVPASGLRRIEIGGAARRAQSFRHDVDAHPSLQASG